MNSQFFSVKAISACVLASAVALVPSMSLAAPNGDGCPSAPVSSSLTAGDGDWVEAQIPGGYNPGGSCFNSAVVEDDDYGVGGYNTRFWIDWAGPALTSGDCTTAYIAAQLWVPSGSTWVTSGTMQQVYGQWNGTSCVAPQVIFSVAAGAMYRIAFQAETQNSSQGGADVAVDVYGSFDTIQ
jgi:hypothetical protein